MISRLPPRSNGANKVLVLAHREELLTQAKRQIERFAPHLKVSIERGRYWSNHDEDDVIVASVPTLGRCDSGERLERFNPESFKAIIIDEAHHSVADTYLRIVKHFQTIPTESDVLVWGCSATFRRNDELILGSVFDKIVYHVDIATMMKEGWLCEAVTKEIYTDVDLKKVKISRGDFETKGLSLAIDTPVRNDLVAGMWKQIAQDEHGRKATIVFALNVAHARNLAESFAKLDVTVALITSETNEAIRQTILEEFSAGKIPLLINCAVLTEGTDLPITDCVVMTRPTCNSNLYVQMVGRGLRRHEGKTYCLVLDFIDQIRSQSRSLITFPSLLGSRQSQEDEVPKNVVRNQFKAAEVDPDKISVRVRTINALEKPTAAPGYGLAWILLDNYHFALTSTKGIFILALSPENRTCGKIYRVFECRTPVPDPKKSRKYYETKALTMGWLPVHQIIPILIEVLESEGILDSARIDSYWRRIRPMTDNQRKFIFRLLAMIPGIDSTFIKQVHSWSIGRASDLITKYYLRTRLLKSPLVSFEDYISGVESYR